MCGRFSQTQSAERLAEVFQLSGVPEWNPRYNIAPTQSIPTVLQTAEQPRQFCLLRWGLIPSWAKDGSIGAKLINARAETVAEKPAFRSAFRQRRCLVLADGFYEWQRLNGKKQPYYFQLTDGEPFAFAGLWESWQGDKESIASCTIITTQANETVQGIHDRMPVLLSPDTYETWLNPSTVADQLHSLLHPYPSDLMQAHPVSTKVNSPTVDAPICTESTDTMAASSNTMKTAALPD